MTWLEERCDEVNATLPKLRSFLLPGGTPAAAQLHVCRTVCRRAERRALLVDGRQPRGRPLPQPALGPALHPQPRRQRAAARSRSGSRDASAGSQRQFGVRTRSSIHVPETRPDCLAALFLIAPGVGPGRRQVRDLQGPVGRRRGDPRRGRAARRRAEGAGDPHVLAVQLAQRPGGARARTSPATRCYGTYGPEGLRARLRGRDRHAQLDAAAGTTAERKESAVGRRRRQLPRQAAVVQRQGRDDRRLVRGHDREHGRRRRATVRRGWRRSSRRPRSAAGTATPTRTACATSATRRSRPTRASTRRCGFDFGFGRTPPTEPRPARVRRAARRD